MADGCAAWEEDAVDGVASGGDLLEVAVQGWRSETEGLVDGRLSMKHRNSVSLRRTGVRKGGSVVVERTDHQIGQLLCLVIGDRLDRGNETRSDGFSGFRHEAVVDARRAEEEQEGGAGRGAGGVGAGDYLDYALCFTLRLGEAVAHERSLETAG